MKMVEFIASTNCPVSLKIRDISVVLAIHHPAETEIYMTGSDDGLVVKGSYAEVMKKIEEAKSADA